MSRSARWAVREPPARSVLFRQVGSATGAPTPSSHHITDPRDWRSLSAARALAAHAPTSLVRGRLGRRQRRRRHCPRGVQSRRPRVVTAVAPTIVAPTSCWNRDQPVYPGGEATWGDSTCDLTTSAVSQPRPLHAHRHVRRSLPSMVRDRRDYLVARANPTAAPMRNAGLFLRPLDRLKHSHMRQEANILRRLARWADTHGYGTPARWGIPVIEALLADVVAGRLPAASPTEHRPQLCPSGVTPAPHTIRCILTVVKRLWSLGPVADRRRHPRRTLGPAGPHAPSQEPSALTTAAPLSSLSPTRSSRPSSKRPPPTSRCSPTTS